MINTEELEMERRRDEDFVEDLTQMDWAEQLRWQYNRIVEQEAEIKGEYYVQMWKRRKGKYVLKKGRKYNPQTM